MNAKNAGPLILFFALALVGIANIRIIGGSFETQQPVAAQKNTEKRGTIAWLVKRAKEQNKTKVFVSPPEESYAEVNGLEDASSLYTTLVVQPVQQKTVVLNDSSLITWHKFKVIEFISYPSRNCSNCVSSLIAPQEMLPLQADELLVPTYGGTLEVDGVQLESRAADFGEHPSRFNKYLVFLSLDPGKGIGRLSLGPQGVFLVNSSDQTQPISESMSPLVRDVKLKVDNSLSKFKDYLRSRLK